MSSSNKGKNAGEPVGELAHPKGRLRRRVFIFGGFIMLVALLVFLKLHLVNREALLFAESGKQTIAFLGEYANRLKAGDLKGIGDLYAENYHNPVQETWLEQETGTRDGVQVFSWFPGPQAVADRTEMQRRVDQLAQRFGHLTRSKYKLARLEEVSQTRIDALTTLWLGGQDSEGLFFEAKIGFQIQLGRKGDQWLITRQTLLEGSTVLGEGKGFTEITAQSGIDFRNKLNPQFETPEWQLKLFAIARYSQGGVSTADYDRDGWYDLLFTGGHQFRLYRNLGDQSFEDVTVQSGLPGDMSGVNTALFADLDNDGYQDLFLVRFTGPSLVYRNLGDGTFEDRSPPAGVSPGLAPVAAAADYDNDGDLDIYLGRYLDPRVKLPATIFYTRNGEGNSLLRNDGNFSFTDVTEEAGVREGGLTLGVAWADYDEDGHMDLYVANDFGRNALFRNLGNGTFEDVSLATQTVDIGYGMSADWGDVNGDGHLDLYVSNVHSGQRWYGHAPTLYNYLLTSVRQGTIREDLPVFRDLLKYFGDKWHSAGDHLIKGNSLFLSDGQGRFNDISVSSATNPFGWYWGSGFLDFDNDGWTDLFAVNGFISAKSQDDL